MTPQDVPGQDAGQPHADPSTPTAAALPDEPVGQTPAGSQNEPSQPVAGQAPAAPLHLPSWAWAAGAGLLSMSAISLGMAWQTSQRAQLIEQTIVKRQQDSQDLAQQAKTLAQTSQDVVRDQAGKLALLDNRVAELDLLRGQLDELMASLSRSRDENLLVDIEASLRVAQQQSALVGGSEPVLAALKTAEERLARHPEPRLERLRRAVARDQERLKAVTQVDLSTVLIRLDEAIRLVDEMPLIASADFARETDAPPRAGRAASAPQRATASQAASAPAEPVEEEGWAQRWKQRLQGWTGQAWSSAKGLIRVTRIDQPEAMLISPEQSFFLRENLKLRLLNARLALLSRQFDMAQSDLQQAERSVMRYFDAGHKRTQACRDLLVQVQGMARQAPLPRPDETLAALQAAVAGR